MNGEQSESEADFAEPWVPLDSHALVQQSCARHGPVELKRQELRALLVARSENGPVKLPSVAEAEQRARRNRRLREQRVAQLRNDRYQFKLTSQRQEVRAHLLSDIVGEDGHWRESVQEQHCRHDGQPFQGPPASIPWYWSRKQGTYRFRGIFCSFSCALAFLQELNNASERSKQLRTTLLQRVARDHFKVERVYPALPLEALRIHGGTMGIEEWRAAGKPQ
jgi:hypothetical protein